MQVEILHRYDYSVLYDGLFFSGLMLIISNPGDE